MRVWIGCLACYNDGTLAGKWFNALDADDVIPAEVCRFGVKTWHEELWVMDMDETRGWLREECSPSEAAQIARTIESIEDNHDDPEMVLAWAEHEGTRDEIVRDEYDRVQRNDFADAYCGEFDNETDYAYNLVDDLGMLHNVDETLANYFDYEAFARDLFMGDNYSISLPGGGIAVFRNL